MDVQDLQTALQGLGLYAGAIDGKFGPISRAGLLAALEGNPARLTRLDLEYAGQPYGLSAAHVGAVVDVESAGRGFHPDSRRPIILYEPHVFSRLTGHLYDHIPEISYRSWGDRDYPSTQAARYEQLIRACAIDPDAAFQSASWGLGQIMGFNRVWAGFPEPWPFVLAMATSEREQLLAMMRFCKAKGLDDELRRGDWAGFARGYNGSGYARNFYDQKLKAAFARRSAAADRPLVA